MSSNSEESSNSENFKAIQYAGWMYAECCALLDRGEDPRKADVAEMLPRMQKDVDCMPTKKY